MAQPTDIPASDVLTAICDEAPPGLKQVLANGRWTLRAAAEAADCEISVLTVHGLIHLLHLARRREPSAFDALSPQKRKKALSVLTRLAEHAVWHSKVRPIAEFPQESGFPSVSLETDGIEEDWGMRARTALRLLFTLTYLQGSGLDSVTSETIRDFEEALVRHRPGSAKQATAALRCLCEAGAQDGWLPDWGVAAARGVRAYSNPRIDEDDVPPSVLADLDRLIAEADWSTEEHSTAEVNRGVYLRYLRFAAENADLDLAACQCVGDTLDVDAILEWIREVRASNGHGRGTSYTHNNLLPLCTLAKLGGLDDVGEALSEAVRYMRTKAGPKTERPEALPTARPLLECVEALLLHVRQEMGERGWDDLPLPTKTRLAGVIRDAALIAAMTIFPMRNRNWRAASLDDLRFNDEGELCLWIEPPRRGKGRGLGGWYVHPREFEQLWALHLGAALPHLQRMNGARSRRLWQTDQSGEISITALSEILHRRTEQLLGRGYRSHLFRHAFTSAFLSWSRGNLFTCQNLLLANDSAVLEAHYVRYNGSAYLRAHDEFAAAIGLERLRRSIDEDDKNEGEVER